MTKKRHQQDIESALSKALEPPKKRTPPPALNEILSQYTPPQSFSEQQPTPPTPHTAATPPTPSTSIAPMRDFAKVANSIVRQAVPAGLFTGKGKQLYDYLYSRTRGAVVPVRAVRVTKESLMRGAGIGSERTLYKNMRRLVIVGLVQVRSLGGEHAGSEYTVLLPEEAQPTPPTAPTDDTHASQKVETLPTAQSGVSGVGLNVEAKESLDEHKTLSFKTKTNDDEAQALSDLNSILIEAVRKITGRVPKASERELWAELARTLVEELNGAAARAESVSSVPAFLNAHLRRKFAQKPPARKGEGKHSISAIEPSASPSEPHRKLSPEDIAAFTATVADLLGEGKTLEEIETQFAESMHPEDWAAVKSMAQGQMAAKEED